MTAKPIMNAEYLKTTWEYSLSPKARMTRLAKYARSVVGSGDEVMISSVTPDSYELVIVSKVAIPEVDKLRLSEAANKFVRESPVKIPLETVVFFTEEEFDRFTSLTSQ